MGEQNARIAEVHRVTGETDIQVKLNLDGSGSAQVETGIGFFKHMLDAFTRHGLFDTTIMAKGDLEVDCHHTIEDTGLALGAAIRKAIGDKQGIRRFGSSILPMDDALVLCAIDLSGRPYLDFEVPFSTDRIGAFDTEMFREFFLALSNEAEMNLHLKLINGQNNHHIAEACFKAFARALDEATSFDPRIQGVLSTKGTL